MRLALPILFVSVLGCKGGPPTATILSPADGTQLQLGESMTFEAELADDRSPVGFLNPVWSSSIQGTLSGTKTFEGSNTKLVVTDLTEGDHAITLTLTDPEENTDSDTINITVLPNALPTVSFTSPADGEIFAKQQSTHVDIEVLFEDLNEESIHDLTLTWSGDVSTASTLPENPSGAGTASLVIADVEPGDYTVGVTATDSYGGAGSAELTFTVIDADQDTDGHYDESWGGDDCDDTNTDVHPGATELCDGIDNDCDGVIDEPDARDAGTWYADSDADGYGDSAGATVACEAPPDTVDRGGDCDDTEPAANPGAEEICDGIDNNCDLEIDESDVCNLKLAGDSQATFYGEQGGDHSGSAVAIVGDVNGDGDSDYLIGAYEFQDTYTRQGAAYLVFGPVSGDKDLAFANMTITGEHNVQYLGTSVAGGVDIDGDGYDDVLIGSPGHQTNGDGAGSVSLLTGGATLVDINNTAIYYGASAGQRAGSSATLTRQLSGLAGSVVIIGAPNASDQAELGGVVYVASDLSGEQTLDSAPVSIWGNASDLAGAAVALQDLDGDGAPGLAITALADQDDAGVIYLFDSVSPGASSVSDADAQLIGVSAGDEAGYSLASQGDFNGDGYDDLLVGAPFESTGGEGAGSAYLVLGPVGSSMSLASADLILRGEAAASYAGQSVELADVDGDGVDDAFVGAPEALGSLEGSGVVYTLWGDAKTSGTLNLGEITPRLEGGLSNEYSGGAIDAGDIDGDGRADLLIGADGNRTNGTAAGATYLLLGSAF